MTYRVSAAHSHSPVPWRAPHTCGRSMCPPPCPHFQGNWWRDVGLVGWAWVSVAVGSRTRRRQEADHMATSMCVKWQWQGCGISPGYLSDGKLSPSLMLVGEINLARRENGNLRYIKWKGHCKMPVGRWWCISLMVTWSHSQVPGQQHVILRLEFRWMWLDWDLSLSQKCVMWGRAR